MPLTFTEAHFFDLFLAFNQATWPVQVALWIASFGVAFRLADSRLRPSIVAAVLAIHWAWSAFFLTWFFSRLYPPAYVFAEIFAFQAVLFAWAGFRRHLAFTWEPSVRHLAGLAFVVGALFYPIVVALSGHEPPRAPSFGVPTPTTLFTTGVLLLASRVPRILLVVPTLWAAIGGGTAVLVGVAPDLMLLAAIPALVLLALPDAVRRRLETWGTTESDADRPMRGDRLVPSPNFSMTLTRTVEAQPADVWPWIAQMGYRRGGLYSYDWLDRLFGYLDAPSARGVLAHFQQLQVGDVIPIGRDGGFPVREVVRCRSLVLGDEGDDVEWSWEIALEPLGNETRIISRARGYIPETIESRIFLALLGLAAFVMTRRMLIGLKVRAERLARQSTRPHAA